MGYRQFLKHGWPNEAPTRVDLKNSRLRSGTIADYALRRSPLTMVIGPASPFRHCTCELGYR
jgi:hypothetical protein